MTNNMTHNPANVIHLADYRDGCNNNMTNDPNPLFATGGCCCVCKRTKCEGDCPVSNYPTFTLVCDICGHQTRVLADDTYTPYFLDDWKQEHEVHHVNVDPPGKYGPPVVGGMNAPVERCVEP
jgi:hypothetical protein